MSAEIRLANPEEAEAVTACVDAAYSKWIEVLGRKPAPMLADYTELIERGVVYVLPDGDKLAGVLVIWPIEDAMLIENIAVEPGYQGKGIGKVLMDFAEVKAREAGLDMMRLYTNQKMEYNQAYYKKLGYDQTRVEASPPDGRLTVWMHKAL